MRLVGGSAVTEGRVEIYHKLISAVYLQETIGVNHLRCSLAVTSGGLFAVIVGVTMNL